MHYGTIDTQGRRRSGSPVDNDDDDNGGNDDNSGGTAKMPNGVGDLVGFVGCWRQQFQRNIDVSVVCHL
jgi:hypothetical protein